MHQESEAASCSSSFSSSVAVALVAGGEGDRRTDTGSEWDAPNPLPFQHVTPGSHYTHQWPLPLLVHPLWE